MKKLGIDARKSIGFQYIIEKMEPDTPYGRDEIKNLKPFQRKERELLQRELDELEKFVTGFPETERLVEQIELVLMGMKEVRGSIKKASSMCLSDVEFFELKNILIQIDKLLPLYKAYKDALGLTLLAFESTDEALGILDPDGRRIPGFYISELYSDELKDIRTEKKRIEVLLRQESEEEDRKRLKQERADIVAREDEEEQKIRRSLTEQLRPYLPQLSHNVEVIGKLDLMLQKMKLARKLSAVKPMLCESGILLSEMKNPEVEEVLNEKGRSFAPVTLSMDEGVTVITGANMGGKSVALKTAALNIYLAQCGFFVCAKTAQLPMFDYLGLIAEEFQSVRDGLSSFGGEIVKLKEALEQMRQGYGFLVLDELARGTNPDEGAMIVRAVVKYLQGQRGMVLLATHYDHIAEYAGSHYQVYGLKKKNMESLEQEIRVMGQDKGIEIISKYMDYGIYRVEDEQDCPRDAIHVCKLLGLQEEVMGFLA